MTRYPAPLPAIPDYVVCPACHGPLVAARDHVTCAQCRASYPQKSTIYFASEVHDADKALQRDLYGDSESPISVNLTYRDLVAYRDYCATITDLIRSQGINNFQFKALKNRQVLDRLGLQPGMHVLDIGSGDGSTLALLSLHYGARGAGIDLAPLAIERCVQANPWEHDYYQADAELLPFQDDTFDAVVSLDVLEHLPNPDYCLAEAVRVLRPGGRALFYAISQRDAYTWHWTQRRLTDGQVGADSGAGHAWQSFLQPATAKGWLEAAGCVEVRITPFHALATLILDERFPGFFPALVRRLWLLKALFGLAELVDRPLTRRGYGNGFYLTGRKPNLL